MESSLTVSVVVVGDQKCGKSNLIERFVRNMEPMGHHEQAGAGDAYRPTGFNKFHLDRMVNGQQRVGFTVWDTAGAQAYDSVRPLAYSEADVFLICFSVTEPSSLLSVASRWIPEILRHRPDQPPVVLCGCKAALREDESVLAELMRRGMSTVTPEEAMAVCAQVGVTVFVDTSARENAAEVFEAFDMCALLGIQAKEELSMKARLPERPPSCGSGSGPVNRPPSVASNPSSQGTNRRTSSRGSGRVPNILNVSHTSIPDSPREQLADNFTPMGRFDPALSSNFPVAGPIHRQTKSIESGFVIPEEDDSFVRGTSLSSSTGRTGSRSHRRHADPQQRQGQLMLPTGGSVNNLLGGGVSGGATGLCGDYAPSGPSSHVSPPRSRLHATAHHLSQQDMDKLAHIGYHSSSFSSPSASPLMLSPMTNSASAVAGQPPSWTGGGKRAYGGPAVHARSTGSDANLGSSRGQAVSVPTSPAKMTSYNILNSGPAEAAQVIVTQPLPSGPGLHLGIARRLYSEEDDDDWAASNEANSVEADSGRRQRQHRQPPAEGNEGFSGGKEVTAKPRDDEHEDDYNDGDAARHQQQQFMMANNELYGRCADPQLTSSISSAIAQGRRAVSPPPALPSRAGAGSRTGAAKSRHPPALFHRQFSHGQIIGGTGGPAADNVNNNGSSGLANGHLRNSFNQLLHIQEDFRPRNNGQEEMNLDQDNNNENGQGHLTDTARSVESSVEGSGTSYGRDSSLSGSGGPMMSRQAGHNGVRNSGSRNRTSLPTTGIIGEDLASPGLRCSSPGSVAGGGSRSGLMSTTSSVSLAEDPLRSRLTASQQQPTAHHQQQSDVPQQVLGQASNQPPVSSSMAPSVSGEPVRNARLAQLGGVGPDGKINYESLKSQASTVSHGSTGSKLSSASSNNSGGGMGGNLSGVGAAKAPQRYYLGPRDLDMPDTENPDLSKLDFVSPKAGVYRPVNPQRGVRKPEKCSLM